MTPRTVIFSTPEAETEFPPELIDKVLLLMPGIMITMVMMVGFGMSMVTMMMMRMVAIDDKINVTGERGKE